jgi:hypothetical protein
MVIPFAFTALYLLPLRQTAESISYDRFTSVPAFRVADPLQL